MRETLFGVDSGQEVLEQKKHQPSPTQRVGTWQRP